MFFRTFSAVLSSLCFCSSHESVSYIPNNPFIFTNHNRFRYTADVFHSEYSIFFGIFFIIFFFLFF